MMVELSKKFLTPPPIRTPAELAKELGQAEILSYLSSLTKTWAFLLIKQLYLLDLTLHKSGFIPAELIFVFVGDHHSASDPNDPVSNDPEFVYTCQIVNSATIPPSTVWSTILKRKTYLARFWFFPSVSFTMTNVSVTIMTVDCNHENDDEACFQAGGPVTQSRTPFN